ncbi:hypothetical protein R6867_15625, partial [Mycobacterium tuberculosis]
HTPPLAGGANWFIKKGVMSINADLADFNAKNRPGAGFVPVPA